MSEPDQIDMMSENELRTELRLAVKNLLAAEKRIEEQNTKLLECGKILMRNYDGELVEKERGRLLEIQTNLEKELQQLREENEKLSKLAYDNAMTFPELAMIVDAYRDKEIATLQAENQRYREALKDIADGYGSYPDTLIKIAKEALRGDVTK